MSNGNLPEVSCGYRILKKVELCQRRSILFLLQKAFGISSDGSG